MNSTSAKKVINIYTDRHYPIDDSIYGLFEKKYGVQVNVVKGKSEDLLERISKEGISTKADILFTSDVGRLHQAKVAGLFQALPTLENMSQLQSHLYDVDKHWVGVSKRSRVIVYHKDRVTRDDLSTYEDLIHSRWKGRIAVRSKGNVYNQSLLASLIVANGEEEALNWVQGIVVNMYQDPKGNDRDQVKAVFMGKADVGIVNTYYIGQMLTSSDPVEREAGNSVGVFFPNQDGRGAHINVSGLGMLKAAKHTEEAKLLIDFLLSKEVQNLYVQNNFEYSVLEDVAPNELVSAWGSFKSDTVLLSQIGENNTEAIKLFDKGGWK
jgi:iron(III) transport system substrate-binding protein